MLCQNTVRALEAVEEIPVPLLNNANSDYLANCSERPPIEFTDESFGETTLDFNTCLYIAEQMYRFQTCTETLALLVNGKFGEMLARIMVLSSMKDKRRHAAEGKFVHRRTSFSNKRSLMDELDVIHETAQCTLFGAVDKMRLLVPLYMGTEEARGSIRWALGEDGKAERDEEGNRINVADTYTLWQDFYAYCPITGEEVRCAAMLAPEELSALVKIMDHNQTCGPNNWQFFLANIKHSDKVDKLFGIFNETYETQEEEEENRIPSINVIRRVYSTLNRPITNCILAAFGAATSRFFIIEYGHNVELMDYIEEHSEKKFAHTSPDMIPTLIMEELQAHTDDTDKLILKVAENCETTDEIIDTLRRTMIKPIARSTFFMRWAKLKTMAEEIAFEKIDLT